MNEPESLEASFSDTLFSIAEQPSGTGVVLTVSGEIDMASSSDFATHLQEAVTGSDRVVVDLRGVGFMDSTGLNTMLRCLRQAERSGTALLIRSPSPAVQRLLEVSGVDRFLSFDTGQDASAPATGP